MSDWKDVASKVINLLPSAGALVAPFLGPVGAAAPLAGTAIKIIAGALGITSQDPQPQEIMTALESNPMASEQLKLALLEFDKEKMRLEFEEKDKERLAEIARLKLEKEDRDRATNREIEYITKLGHADYSMEILGWLIVIGFFTILGIRLFVVIAPTQLENVGILMGFLGAGFMAVVQYKFGSSSGSAAKSKAMEKALLIK